MSRQGEFVPVIFITRLIQDTYSCSILPAGLPSSIRLLPLRSVNPPPTLPVTMDIYSFYRFETAPAWTLSK